MKDENGFAGRRWNGDSGEGRVKSEELTPVTEGRHTVHLLLNVGENEAYIVLVITLPRRTGQPSSTVRPLSNRGQLSPQTRT